MCPDAFRIFREVLLKLPPAQPKWNYRNYGAEKLGGLRSLESAGRSIRRSAARSLLNSSVVTVERTMKHLPVFIIAALLVLLWLDVLLEVN